MSLSLRTNSAPSSDRPEQPPHGTGTELQPVHNGVIPDELLVSLTSTVCNENTLKPSAHQRHCKGCTFRRPDAVWHHPLGRKKYKHFLEQPTSLTGAGRDISFLCDAGQRTAITLPPLSVKAADTQNMTVLESLIPEEYHIVKNKGLRGLELYEDAFTVQLQDDEQKLRVFPSMKPSGRQEVLQLMRVMDDMLEKAGVQPQEELNQLSQIEGLLDLVRTEQNIYNVVFHELIRQVSVGCAERGQLLAKLRQRYQSLLERIPRYLKALHTEAVAQRALDRQLTVEIHRIKTSIQQLSRELARIKDHDAFVSQQAERAQHELAQALGQSQNNAEVVQRYHELYELQRSRLNSQMHQMAEERDLWSQFTYCLALKLIRVKDLQLVAQLHSSEETWHQTAERCSLYIATMDIEDLQCFSDIVVLWREELQRFMSGLKKRDQAQSQHLCPIQQALSKWQAFCTSQQQNHIQKYPRASVEEIHSDLIAWVEVLGGLRECFQGEEVLAHKEALESLVTVRDKWVDLGLQLLRRHSSPENAPSQHYQNLTELQILFSELNELLNDHITGENGLHSQLQSLSESIEPWRTNLCNLKEQPHKALVLDLKQLEKSLDVWQSLLEKVFQLISGVQAEGHSSEPALYTQTKAVTAKATEFVETISSFVDTENQTASREISSVHMARSRWMQELLLLLVPNLDEQSVDRQKNPPCRTSQSSSWRTTGAC
uniref:Axonemal dynein light chain domain containing 1 n=1 Tax=Neogobius melanostomus TaxID=47308 RepID=A0A8C6SML8_9GOBI